MWRKLDELKQTLSGFVEQRESLLLVVSSADLEVPYVLKTLEGIDDTSPSDLFLTFAEPFTRAPEYAAAIMKHLRGQMAVARAKGEGEPFPPLPAICDDEAAPPPARLRAAVDHVAALVPARGGHKVVWGLLPLHVADQEGYARIVGQFVPWRGPEPWMRGLRVVARDDRERPFLSPALRKNKAPGVLLYEMDMSPEALNDALVKGAGDRSLAPADRMQALIQLAGLDVAYRRYPEALDKYRRLYDFYAEHHAPAMQAVALQGVGDVTRRQGDRKGAKLRYQQGLTLAMQTQALPVMLHLTYAIGDVSLELGDDRDAEGFFGLAEKLAGKLMNPYVKAQALEQQGIARTRLGDAAGALVAWRGADALCKAFSYHERRRSVLERLIGAYQAAYMNEERHACEVELRAVKQAIKDRAQAAHDQPHPARADAT
jgi:tetratricopeptide (TPR) repeat protein